MTYKISSHVFAIRLFCSEINFHGGIFSTFSMYMFDYFVGLFFKEGILPSTKLLHLCL